MSAAVEVGVPESKHDDDDSSDDPRASEDQPTWAAWDVAGEPRGSADEDDDSRGTEPRTPDDDEPPPDETERASPRWTDDSWREYPPEIRLNDGARKLLGIAPGAPTLRVRGPIEKDRTARRWRRPKRTGPIENEIDGFLVKDILWKPEERRPYDTDETYAKRNNISVEAVKRASKAKAEAEAAKKAKEEEERANAEQIAKAKKEDARAAARAAKAAMLQCTWDEMEERIHVSEKVGLPVDHPIVVDTVRDIRRRFPLKRDKASGCAPPPSPKGRKAPRDLRHVTERRR